MFEFCELPTELQLRVMECLPVRSLLKVLESNRRLNVLGLSTLASNVNDQTVGNNSVSISIFSPQNKDRLIETFSTVCVSGAGSRLATPTSLKSCGGTSIDMEELSERLATVAQARDMPLSLQPLHEQSQRCSTVFELGSLEYRRDPLRGKETAVPNHDGPENPSILHLIVNEEEPYINVQFEMHLNGRRGRKSLFKFSSRIAQLASKSASSGVLSSENQAVAVQYTLEKGDELPPRGGYDYDVFHNYFLHFENLQIKNTYFLDCIEATSEYSS